MRTFNYSDIKNQKWDSEILGLIAAIYKEAGKQEMYLKQRPEEQQKLAKVHDKLKTAVHEVQKVNGQNRTLIQNALEMVEFDMNMLQSMKAAPETANYNKGAYNTGAHMGVGAKGFDAKQ